MSHLPTPPISNYWKTLLLFSALSSHCTCKAVHKFYLTEINMFKYTLKHLKTYILTDFEFPWGFVLFNSPTSHTHIMRTTWLARPGNTGLVH